MKNTRKKMFSMKIIIFFFQAIIIIYDMIVTKLKHIYPLKFSTFTPHLL